MSVRYELKKQLTKKAVVPEAVAGSVGKTMSLLDALKFGNTALIETFEGMNGVAMATAQNTNALHDFGAVWVEEKDTTGTADAIAPDKMAVATAATLGDACSLIALKPFYIDYNNSMNGLVFEAVVKLADSDVALTDIFIGLANQTSKAVVDDLEDVTDLTKRVGFCVIDGTKNISAVASDGTTASVSTLATVADLSTEVKLKAVVTSTAYTALGVTYPVGIKWYIDDVEVVLATTITDIPSGDVPLLPYIYVEASTGAARTTTLSSVKVYYF